MYIGFSEIIFIMVVVILLTGKGNYIIKRIKKMIKK